MSGSFSEFPAIILCGGRGARFDHETKLRPKPLIEVAGKPILTHIMDSLFDGGVREFILAKGYLGGMIDDLMREIGGERVGIDTLEDRTTWNLDRYFGERSIAYTQETGEDSPTGERLRRCAYIVGDRQCLVTYGDGLSDVPIDVLREFHEHQKRWVEHDVVSITAVRSPGRFGVLRFDDMSWHEEGNFFVDGFEEKSEDWINGGFMVVEGRYLAEAHGSWESDVLPSLAAESQLCAYQHEGYWRCMDTRRDLEQIEADALAAGRLPWRR